MLKDKVIIVTGTAGGLGRSMAIEFASQGAKVVINDVQEEGMKETEQMILDNGRTVKSILADVSSKAEGEKIIDTAVKEFGTVDVIVNNAALLADFKPSLGISEEEWDRIMAVNLKGVYLMTNTALPLMLEKGAGTFINICSIGGSIAGVGDAAYITAKHGVIGYTKQLAFNYANKGIRAVTLSPGLTDTPMVRYAIDAGREEVMRQIEATPAGNIGKAEDVAYLAAFLASDRARHINGVDYKIDGAQSVL
ncbi:SDR family NAD(P)-dependent oxidoreductase [Falseniella ignava]|uniref:3-oxoacyl-[acyl-carrier-protein] reductase n=1 Tax=Falseniella ignava CCUG 37419 TaxID=883112 RepID=K1M0D5_9LACT|nr:glucose 1-dehydrogenase [Falseniella ignava]EKB55758.1 hypothetical protein HMPREF9707_00945 [Falseniella ignava CCUG 37419]